MNCTQGYSNNFLRAYQTLKTERPHYSPGTNFSGDFVCSERETGFITPSVE